MATATTTQSDYGLQRLEKEMKQHLAFIEEIKKEVSQEQEEETVPLFQQLQQA